MMEDSDAQFLENLAKTIKKKSFTCPCNRTFYRKDNYRSHMLTKHNSIVPKRVKKRKDFDTDSDDDRVSDFTR